MLCNKILNINFPVVPHKNKRDQVLLNLKKVNTNQYLLIAAEPEFLS